MDIESEIVENVEMTHRKSSESSVIEDQMRQMTQEMGSITNTLKDLHNKFENRIDSLEIGLHRVRSRLSEVRDPDPEIHFNFSTNSQEQQMENVSRQNVTIANNMPSLMQNVDNQHATQSSATFGNTNTNHNFVQQNSMNNSTSCNLKMKVQAYDGQTDIGEYLTQFNLIAEINNWSYKPKSLYLASSLTGSARSLLTELTEFQKRDFDSLVELLRTRYGTRNKAEIYRSQLKSIHKHNDQSIPELAAQVKKLTRQAYPDANMELTEILALDYFIDSLDDSDIRLRLRECCQKSISEAETIAVRLETHKLADKQRMQNVNAYTGKNHHKINSKNEMETVLEKLEKLTDRVEKLDVQKNVNKRWGENERSHSDRDNTTHDHSNNDRNKFHAQGYRSNYRGYNNNRYSQNHNYSQDRNKFNGKNQNNGYHGNRNSNNRNLGNGSRSSWGTATRPHRM